MLKNHVFFLSYIDRFGEKSQKLLKNRDFEHLEVVFETFIQNGQNKIEKRWTLSLCPQYLWIVTPQADGRKTLKFRILMGRVKKKFGKIVKKSFYIQ